SHIGLYRKIVNNFGAYKNKLWLIENYHIVEYSDREGVYVHYDVYNPLRIEEAWAHFYDEFVELMRGNIGSIFVDRHMDINSKSNYGK
ncbi:MAG: hypothetical protein PHP69_06965, partial [Candidatus Omnitrophica bacterium]|nr:hypothetical protein [Candidatus Omnitrophota bacterium]